MRSSTLFLLAGLGLVHGLSTKHRKASTLIAGHGSNIVCPGQSAEDYCDCSGDCHNHPTWCSCPEAMACCGSHGGSTPTSAPTTYGTAAGGTGSIGTGATVCTTTEMAGVMTQLSDACQLTMRTALADTDTDPDQTVMCSCLEGVTLPACTPVASLGVKTFPTLIGEMCSSTGGGTDDSTGGGGSATTCQCFANGSENEPFCEQDATRLHDVHSCVATDKCHWGPGELTQCAEEGAAATPRPTTAPTSAPTSAPTTAPTSAPSATCIPCTDEPTTFMTTKGKQCTTWGYAYRAHCNKNSFWATKKFCQYSCFMNNVGYEGDNCCVVV